MVAPYANIKSADRFDGLVYCSERVMPAAEGDLAAGQSALDQRPLPCNGISNGTATVVFTSQGGITNATAYVVLQTDCGDEKWIDLAWCNLAAVPAAGTFSLFYLATGQFGPNSFQQTRAVGAAPSPANSFNAGGLLGRVRFVGKAAVNVPGNSPSSSSSSLASASSPIPTGILVTIRVKLQGLR